MDEDQRFCENPWTYCEIYAGGGVYICCPAWNRNIPVGNIYTGTPKQIWNSYQAQQFRRGILDGSFCACDHEKCPSLIARSLPTVAEVRQTWLGSILSDAIDNRRAVAAHGPSVVKIGYDASCNLICPSCRTELMVAKKQEQERLNQIRDKFILPFLEHARILVMSSDGDPFASNHYRDILRLTYEKLPDLKIGLCTNAVLLDQRAWDDCHLEGRVVSVQVSVDAARKETYNYVRRGGDFDRLKRNLHFLSGKRRSSTGFTTFDLLFVVQACNFREMAEFVELGEAVGADSVQFMLIDHWGRAMGADEYKHAKIWDSEHPDNADFRKILANDVFRRPIVKLGNVEAIMRSEQPPELHIDFKTGEISRTVASAL
ncbi:SPASM domain-containing protein [Belnapia sp. T6]|uniref:SPASM domain-containing protein n=1 Tax=Belnapia mucosa TaxID=2804532 RepID=A0ABS1V830_9PROT|nr:radical SAM protein [Belnapia mucosa]MBL6457830.1 SPASM domain-containing protein [Belnapia mucosa]